MHHVAEPDREAVHDGERVTGRADRSGELDLGLDRGPRRRSLGPVGGDPRVEVVRRLRSEGSSR